MEFIKSAGARTGLFFGATSGVITTIGLMTGLLLPLATAVLVSIAWGMLVISVLSYFLARAQGESPWPIIAEHLGIAILVVFLSHFIGVWVASTFG